MFTAIGVLVDMRGVIKLLQAICSGLMLTEEDGRTILTNRSRYTDPFMYANQHIFVDDMQNALGTPLLAHVP
jgi:hypothetical protein